MNERQLCNQIIEFLNYQGAVYCWRVNSGMMKSEYQGKERMIRLAQAGTSDILGIMRPNGQMICIEVKLPKTRSTVTRLQQEYLDKMKSYGALTGVATSCEEALDLINGAS